MQNNNIEKGDVVAIRGNDGTTKEVTVLQVKADYEQPGAFERFDYIDYSEASPMRRVAKPKDLLQILRKNPGPKLDPKAAWPGDGKPATQEVVINGKRYVEKVDNKEQTVPLNEQANTQVHPAVKAPAKPVTERIKKSKTTAQPQ